MKNLTLTFFIHDNPSHDVDVATTLRYDPEGVMGHHGPMENGDINLDALPENPERLTRPQTSFEYRRNGPAREQHEGFHIIQRRANLGLRSVARSLVDHAELVAETAGRDSMFMYSWVRVEDSEGPKGHITDIYVGTPCTTLKQIRRTRCRRSKIRNRHHARDMVVAYVREQLEEIVAELTE